MFTIKERTAVVSTRLRRMNRSEKIFFVNSRIQVPAGQQFSRSCE
ncbi:unnamed protein product [Larinioides sclopetarius]|uniref:Uncharacterized protein n=1 Tax=Larinioides sclopetarius TaxID=280406 RepID=A0AAV2ALK3_9ARAC